MFFILSANIVGYYRLRMSPEGTKILSRKMYDLRLRIVSSPILFTHASHLLMNLLKFIRDKLSGAFIVIAKCT